MPKLTLEWLHEKIAPLEREYINGFGTLSCQEQYALLKAVRDGIVFARETHDEICIEPDLHAEECEGEMALIGSMVVAFEEALNEQG